MSNFQEQVQVLKKTSPQLHNYSTNRNSVLKIFFGTEVYSEVPGAEVPYHKE